MDLIVLSKNFPRNYSSQIGVFVEEQVRALRRHIDGSITVVSPVPWSPRILWFREKWREYGKAEREKSEGGIKIYYPRYLVIPGGLFFPLQGFFMYLAVIFLIKSVMRSHRGKTVLHTHTILPDGLAGALIRNTLHIPHICTIHGSDINFYPFRSRLALFLTKYALDRCDHIITVSHVLKERVQAIAHDPADFTIIHNGADHEKFVSMPRAAAKKRLGVEEERKIIMSVGNLVPVKGTEYLIRAFRRLVTEYGRDDIVLFLIGDGSERGRLAELAKSLKLGGKVLFCGRKPHEEIPLWLNIADIFVLPSVSEGFPTIIPEAMMCGIPVVASDVGGMSEIICSGVNGILTIPRDTELISESIRLLLEDDSLRERMAAAARKACGNFTWEDNAIKSVAVYKMVCSEHGGAAGQHALRPVSGNSR